MKLKLSVVCLLLAIAAALFAGCGSSGSAAPDSTTIETKATETKKDEDIVIKTKYVDLHYPLIWEDRFSYEISEEDPYTVKGFAAIDEHKPVEIFEIVFDAAKGDIAGKIDGVSIGIVISEVKYDKTWTEGEKSAVIAMQEDINYLLDMLDKADGFSAK